MSLYDTGFERYGQAILKAVRDYEKYLSRFNKPSLNIGFLQKCKLFHLFSATRDNIYIMAGDLNKLY